MISETSKVQFLSVAKQIHRAITEVIREARRVSSEYEKIITAQQKIAGKYTDYEMFVVVIPYLTKPDNYPMFTPKSRFSPDLIVFQKSHLNSEENIYEKQSINWNIEELNSFNDEEYINYYMHVLVSHLGWTIREVNQLDHLYIKTVVSLQRRRRKDKVVMRAKIININ